MIRCLMQGGGFELPIVGFEHYAWIIFTGSVYMYKAKQSETVRRCNRHIMCLAGLS